MAVFLSASIPDPRRHTRYFQTADVVCIREAVVALVREVLPRTWLVFGGHPAISPLVVLVAERLQRLNEVKIYQSEFFRSEVPKESLAFPHLVWTPRQRDEDQSLRFMREQMLQDNKFTAAVFIGGMEGVEKEHALFCRFHPQVPTYAVASTGGAALLLWQQYPHGDANLQGRLSKDCVYNDLFQDLVGIGR